MIVALSSHSVWFGLALTLPTVVALLIASWLLARDMRERICNLVYGFLGVVAFVSVLVVGTSFFTRFQTPEFDKYSHAIYLIAAVGALFGVAIGFAARTLGRWRESRRV